MTKEELADAMRGKVRRLDKQEGLELAEFVLSLVQELRLVATVSGEAFK